MKSVFSLLVMIIFSISVFSQQSEEIVARSKNKTSIDGKKYYLHSVKKGETLFSICKAYNIAQKDVAIDNPDVFNGISPDQIIKIPIIEGINSTEEEILSAGKYRVIKVEKGQTLYSIAKTYNQTIEEIYSINPEAKSGIKEGQLIRVNKESVATEIIETNYIDYEVRKKETLYSISKKHDLEVADILTLNPDVEKNGLKDGQIIKLPLNKKEKKDSSKKDTRKDVNVDKETVAVLIPDSQIVVKDLKESFSSKSDCDKEQDNKTVNVALFLPFCNERNRNLEVDKLAKEEESFFPGTKFIEFYEGLLLAIDSIRKEGVSVNIKVFDTRNDSTTIANLLNKNELGILDLIIGPVNPVNISLVSEYSKENRIPMVCPFGVKHEQLNENPYLFSVLPSNTKQNYELLRFIIDKYPNKNYLVIHSDKKDELENVAVFKRELTTIIPETDLMYKELMFTNLSGLDASLRTDTLNIIYIPSSDQATVTGIISKLSLKAKKYRMVVIGMPSWRRYDNIDLEYFHRLNTHTYTNAYVDYSSISVNNFIREYRFMYKAEPSNPFSYLGFDATYYFIHAIQKYGKEVIECIPNFKMKLLQTEFNFDRLSPESGFENKTVFIIKYLPDFTIVKIN
jgi:LysM repeat protein